MPKKAIFSRINLKDYNSILEDILEQKVFSEDTKNLLLSMLYKIENGYQDYKTVKVNVSQKNYFLQKIIKTIKEDCKKIELVKPLSDESRILEKENVNFIVNKNDGVIKSYPNERFLLEALVALSGKEVQLDEEYKIYEKGIEEILTKGNRMNVSEVIRDFNGFSWDITTSQMESKNINLVYQNLIILLGKNFMMNWATDEKQDDIDEDRPNNEILRSKYNNSFGLTKEEVQENQKIDYIQLMKEKLEDKYGIENAQAFLEQLKKVLITIGYNTDQNQKKIILDKKKEIEEKFKKIQNNKKFLEEISQIKKDTTKEIKEIDKILSDEILLKKEYQERNSKLPNKEKIFSTSHLKIMLENERNNKINKIKNCNKQMEPKQFMKMKQEFKKNYEFFEELNLEQDKKADEQIQIEKLQLYFLDCFMEKIKKDELKDLIFELRYYEQIPFENACVCNIKFPQFEEKLNQTEEMLIKLACDSKILTTFTTDEKLNKQILSNQFKSKIINLENTIYILKYRKGFLKIQVYDSNIEDETKELQINEKVELNVKLNKKIKLWE